MNVLVGGGAGFIGSHLCDRLLAQGHTVVCADNLVTGSQENVAHLVNQPGFSLLEQDITIPFDPGFDLDSVLNFASPASPVSYLKHPIETLQVGALGTLNLLELAKQHEAKFLLASTSEVYGDPQVHPQKESYWGNVNPIGPRSVYDEAKRFAEAATQAYHRTHGVEVRIARIFNTYGPRMDPADGRAVPNFITQALAGQPLTLYGDGSQTRSFCYISDLTEGLLKLLESDCVTPVNLGNSTETSLKTLAELVLRLTGSTSSLVEKPLPQDDPKVRCPDLSLAKAKLDWAPTVALEQGLAETIRWFQGQK